MHIYYFEAAHIELQRSLKINLRIYTDNCESISELQILTAKISSTKQVSWRQLKIFMAGQTSVCILMQMKKNLEYFCATGNFANQNLKIEKQTIKTKTKIQNRICAQSIFKSFRMVLNQSKLMFFDQSKTFIVIKRILKGYVCDRYDLISLNRKLIVANLTLSA